MTDKYEQLLTYVEIHNITHVSFDIFDTLVFRHVHLPAELFVSIPSIEGETKHTLSALEFRTLREQAERVARKKEHVKEDINLAQIYAEFPFNNDYKLRLMEAELQAEKKGFVLNEKLMRYAELLSKKGLKVCLISDMYLSKEQIRATFLQSTFLETLPLYVSSELGLTKFSGKLFGHVAKELNINVSQWLHVGDNADTDIRSAKAVGLHTLHFHPSLDTWQIRDAERRQFQVKNISSANRLLATLDNNASSTSEQTAYELGAFTWGPILTAFSEWVINTADKTHCTQIICLMREAYVFTPLINKYLELTGRKELSVVSLCISRKAAFWPSIDVGKHMWLEELMDTLMTYRGYTLENFVHDFGVAAELLNHLDPRLELKNIEGIFVQGEALYTRLFRDVDKNRSYLIAKIEQQKSYLIQYYRQICEVPLSQCAVVDFGNGGTIQHSLERIFEQQAGANILFYSSERIYRFINETFFHAFIPFDNDKFRVSETLARSPECIEALLLGDTGSTLEYKNQNGTIIPITAMGLQANNGVCNQFLAGVLSFVERSVTREQKTISKNNAMGILARYIGMPTPTEANLFSALLHQDNFGTDGEYPVIDNSQKDWIQKFGLDNSLLDHNRVSRWQLGHIYWPQGVISAIDGDILPQYLGLVKNDNIYYIQQLIQKIIRFNLKNITVYGAGEFYIQTYPYLQQHSIVVDCLVDRRAEVGEPYEIMGQQVVALDLALAQGHKNFVICSMAFREEIAKRIYQMATMKGLGAVNVLSV